MRETSMVIHVSEFPASRQVPVKDEECLRVVCDEEMSAKIMALPRDCHFSLMLVACCCAGDSTDETIESSDGGPGGRPLYKC